MCRGGSRLGNSVVTILLMQNKHFPGGSEEPNKVPGADKETKSHLHKQFFGIWQVLRGVLLESLYVNATQIRNKWRDICSIVATMSG